MSPRPSVPVSPPDTVCPTGPGGDGSQWGPHGVGWRNAAPWGNGAHLGQRAQLQRAALWGWQWGRDAGGAPPPSSPINNPGCDPKGWRWGGGKPQPSLLPEGPISLCPHISVSPYLCVPISPCPHISVSPYLRVPTFPSPHVPSCPGFPPPHVPHIILHWDLCAPCAPTAPHLPFCVSPPSQTPSVSPHWISPSSPSLQPPPPPPRSPPTVNSGLWGAGHRGGIAKPWGWRCPCGSPYLRLPHIPHTECPTPRLPSVPCL